MILQLHTYIYYTIDILYCLVVLHPYCMQFYIFTCVGVGKFRKMYLYTSQEAATVFLTNNGYFILFFCTVWFWLLAFKGAIKYAWKERGEGSQVARRKSAPAQAASRLLRQRRGNFCLHLCREFLNLLQRQQRLLGIMVHCETV